MDVVFSSHNLFVWSDEVIVYDLELKKIWSSKASIDTWLPNIAIAPDEKTARDIAKKNGFKVDDKTIFEDVTESKTKSYKNK